MTDFRRSLVGRWRGRGHGDYPTIEPFDYDEEVTFVAPAGKTFLAYVQLTWRADTDESLHSEAGYLRFPDNGSVEFIIAQPTGIAELLTGRPIGTVLDLRAEPVSLTPTAKAVHSVRRRFAVSGDTLTYEMWMAHGRTPETLHLTAELHRQVD